MEPKEPEVMKGTVRSLIDAAIIIAIGLASWSLITSVAMSREIATINATIHTDTEALVLEIKMRAEITAGIDEIKDCLNKIQQNRPCE